MAPAMMSFGAKQCRLMPPNHSRALSCVRMRPWQAAARGLQKITAGTADPLKSKAFAARRR
jgi:hypothetical protein